MEYKLRSGVLDDMIVEIEVEDNSGIGIEIAGMGSVSYTHLWEAAG